MRCDIFSTGVGKPRTMTLRPSCIMPLWAVFWLLPLVLDGKDDEKQFDWARERTFWSFKKPVTRATPQVANHRWPRAALDFFVLAKLEQRALAPAPEADKRTLARRVTFDLTGLPPTPAEVETFLNDPKGDAYARFVDRLLWSPAFGERMASLWLPLARYAEDQAHQIGDDTKFFYPNAYKYRQWLIEAFNRDLPYDQFLKLQLAADQLEGAPPSDLPALGFIGLGPKYYNRGETSVMADEWEDRVDTVCRTMLGLTVACARCHDHKFEPITSRDYYALAGVFASTRMVNKTPAGQVEKAEPSAAKMDADTLHIVEDGDIHNLNIFVRGDPERKGPVAERGFLELLSGTNRPASKHGSGRKELAEAIASAGNPLTARVFVNRVWALFFGEPLAATPSNFGHAGQPPSNPELLDDLAARFMANGWSVKKLVREFVTSASYRQSCRASAGSSNADPSNELLGHMNRRRLSVEQWRDAVLMLSGELSRNPGKSLELDDPTNFRRTVYARISRLKLNDTLMQFDYPDANVHAEKRSVTTTPMQKLFMLNSGFVIGRAKAFAANLQRDRNGTAGERVRHAYQSVYTRNPAPDELALAVKFLGGPSSGGISRWEQYAQMLLVSNELLYVD